MSYLCTLPLFLGNLRGWEWIIIIGVILLLFGGARSIHKTMKNLGKGVNAFKQGLEDAKAEMNKPIERAQAKPDEPAADKPAADEPAKPATNAAPKDIER